MPNRKTRKTISRPKRSKCVYDSGNVLRRPTTWVMAVLLLALLVVYGLSMYGFKNIDTKTSFDSSKLAVFDHLAQEYIKDMEFTTNDQPTVKQITGYGVSDEDGVFYITFDFAPYVVENNNRVIDTNVQHGIMYFWEDAERGTYSHAFSYHDDADYHPEGTYIKVEQ